MHTDADSVHELFRRQAGRTPDRVAVRDADGAWTYAELDAEADRIGHALRAAGAAPGDRIGIHLTRTRSMVAAVLGVLRTGASYLPLETEYPAERLAFMAEDAGVALLVAEAATAAAFEGWCRIVRADELPEPRAAMEPAATAPDAVAYVIYTSGSTGRPKGALLTHRGLVNILEYAARTFGFGEDDSVLAMASFSFDFAQLEILLPLVRGGCVHLADRGAARDPERFAAALADRRPTFLMGTPSLFGALAANGWRPSAELRIIAGGEALPRRTAIALDSADQVWNIYGPTETTIFSTTCRVDPWDITIGAPVSGTFVDIVKDGTPCEDGETGEILIGGVGLAEGYLNRPELTAERFVPDPRRPGGRLYRTGDLGRRRPNGEIDYVGRIDDQVKIRGNRVELGEVETRLAEHPAVAEAAVVLEKGDGTARLVAYVAPREGGDPTPAELAGHLAAVLPGFAVPGRITVLPALPRSANGKIDRLALGTGAVPAPDARPDTRPDAQQPAEARPAGAPDAAWEVLAEACREVLEVPGVRPEDDFFALGGDSLGAMTLTGRALEKGLRLRVADVYQAPDLGALARLGTAAPAAAHPAAAVPAPDGPPRLTPAQHRFLAWEHPEPDHYNVTLLAGTSHRLDQTLLRRALEVLCERHSGLRSRFTRNSGTWELSHVPVPEAVALAWHREDTTADAEEHADRLQRSLNVETGPVWRAAYFERPAGDRLLIAFHHLVCDGLSLQILARELGCAYLALAGGADTWHAAAPPSSSAYANSLHRLANGPLGELLAETWRELPWEGLRPLPADRPGGSMHLSHISSFTVTWSTEVTEALTAARRRPLATAEEALVSAISAAHAAETGGSASAVALCRHGRTDPSGAVEPGGSVGWLNSVTPYVVDVPRDRSDAALLAETARQLRRIRGFEVTWGALRFLHDDAAARAALAALPKPDIYLNYLGHQLHDVEFSAPFHAADGDLGLEMTRNRSQPYKIKIHADVTGGRLRAKWSYSRDAHDEATVRRIAEAAEKLLIRFAAVVGEDAR
ncbi:amino acid adenylation domain-containing protein [Streptomyces sp. NPDC004126]|uniref:amino acid adenylation domain-containing protein n=1 Tax=Streptomyces sp. NPDC004126 TaxID=3390695 RepID=UPI003D05864B